jgi:D-glycero-alpha-D-manno-heptose-7-phosphate kinase
VVSVAINRYVSVKVFPRSFDGGVWLTGEHSEQASGADGIRNRFARAALLRAGVQTNVQVTSCTDAPSGSGLGGSGAFTVALLHSLMLSSDPKAAVLAEEASAIEMADLGRPVGKHDHYMAAYGGLRALRIESGGVVGLESLESADAVTDYVRDRLMLFHTGLSRDAGQVLTKQDQLTRRGDSSVLWALRSIRRIADEMLTSIKRGQVDDIGPLLHEHWQHKVRLSEGVTNPRIDALYEVARAAGSEGGKLLGAGGGGFLLISAAAGRAEEIRQAMASARVRELPFSVDITGSIATGLPL